MKRFLLFFGVNYYPDGGANDLIGSFETLEAAIESALDAEKERTTRYDYTEFENSWAHIYDLTDEKIVWTSEMYIKENTPLQ